MLWISWGESSGVYAEPWVNHREKPYFAESYPGGDGNVEEGVTLLHLKEEPTELGEKSNKGN